MDRGRDRSDRGCTVRIACAADDRYAMPLTVTLLSVALHLEAESDLEVLVLNDDISADNRMRMLDSLKGFPVTVRWLDNDFSALNDFPISNHVSHVAYCRLLLSRVLPDDLDRVLYLDSDLLVLGNLAEIWRLPFSGSALRAVQDIACPLMDAGSDARARRARPYLAKQRPVPNYRALGIPGEAPYFNSGVMLVDLAAWRTQELCQKYIDCLNANAKYASYWDQYALNVVLVGNWRPLPLPWNQGAHVYRFPSEALSPVDGNAFVAMRTQPKIVHFTTRSKPWHFNNRHPYRDAFFAVLDRTAWAGWRPERPKFALSRWAEDSICDALEELRGAYFKAVNAVTR